MGMRVSQTDSIAMIDWFKAMGMFLIVFGHLDGGFINTLTLPIRLKQLGVVFFIFIMGWQLAREKRTLRIVLFNRLFKIYFWGLFFALILSVVGLIFHQNLCESNYLPFLVGINVLMNYFPANPTTWYIGSYIHLLIVWALFFRKWRVTVGLILCSLVVEVVIRGILMHVGLYRAYMLLFNWQTVFLAGMFFGQRRTDMISDKKKMYWAMLLYAVFTLLWFSFVKLMPIERKFPFDLFLNADGDRMLFVTSVCISLVYIGNALLFFNLAKLLPWNKWVQFFSRNTLIIFILHMPVWYLIAPYMKSLFPWHPVRIVLDLAVLYVGIGLLSSFLETHVPWKRCKQMLQSRWIGSEAM